MPQGLKKGNTKRYQIFLERAAKDYGLLAQQLILKLAKNRGISLNLEFPLESFHAIKQSKAQVGKMGEWEYFLHGYHCRFKSQKTSQTIEVSLIGKSNFGGLDPWFFVIFLKTTPAYQPLPFSIHDDYQDGRLILDSMLAQEIFEELETNIPHRKEVVVKIKN